MGLKFKHRVVLLLLIVLVGTTRQAMSAPKSLSATGNGKSATSPVVVAGATNGKFRVARFGEALGLALTRRGSSVVAPCDPHDALAVRILHEYGAVFLASGDVLTPPVCIFTDAEQVASFHKEARAEAAIIDGVTVELQPAAMRALLAACAEAAEARLRITPRDGSEAARRTYADTQRLWNSRLHPALRHWSAEGKLTLQEVERVLSLPVREQVGAVLELEGHGIFFSKDFSRTILHSVAAPGTSQHLSLLAFDVNEYADPKVRRILARHGWFRTVRNDAPHFTYLGLSEQELPAHGLKLATTREGEFWVPNV